MKTLFLLVILLPLMTKADAAELETGVFVQALGSYRLNPQTTLVAKRIDAKTIQCILDTVASVKAMPDGKPHRVTSQTRVPLHENDPFLFYWDSVTGTLWIASPQRVDYNIPGDLLANLSAHPSSKTIFARSPKAFRDKVRKVFPKASFE